MTHFPSDGAAPVSLAQVTADVPLGRLEVTPAVTLGLLYRSLRRPFCVTSGVAPGDRRRPFCVTSGDAKVTYK